MAYTNHFWKQIQQQSKKSTLSEMYRMVVENENVALYSKDIGDSTVIPPAPEGIDKVTVVPKNYLNKIRSLSKFQSDQNQSILPNLFSNKAGISTAFHKFLKPVIKTAVESSGYEYTTELLILAEQLNGFFNITEKQTYNAITIVEEFLAGYSGGILVDQGLKTFLMSILADATKFASMAVGPGELYFILFSNAKVAGSGKSKSGDLQADGEVIELKSSGARMGAGASKYASQASINVNKFLKEKNSSYIESGFFEREKNNLVSKLIELLNQETDIQQFLNKAKQIIDTEEVHSQVARGFKSRVFKPLETLLSNKGITNLNWTTMVNAEATKLATRAGSSQLGYMIFNILKKIGNSHLGKEESLDTEKLELPGLEKNLAYLLTNTFDILKKLDINSITKEDVIDLISITNSYSPEELLDCGYSIKEDLLNHFSNRTVESILNLSSGALLNLVGAMHLASYAQEKKFNKLMFLNKSNGEVIVFSAPMSIQEGLDICKRPDIQIDAGVDPTYASTCKYTYKT